MEYKVTYSKRRTIAIYVHKNGGVEVKCPFHTSNKTICELIEKKKDWIAKTIKKMSLAENVTIKNDEREELIERAKRIIPEKVKYYGRIMGVTPHNVRIGNAKTYWGCCSGKNNLNFSWRLMMTGDKTINYVVVHELAHIKEHNHSRRFWAEVGKIIPDYKVCIEELRKLG